MPQYEGFVLKTGGRNEAEVMIHPERAGIIGASNLTVCHAASESSNICASAENSIGAEAGDRVCIRRDGSALFKNVSTLIGVPLLGLAAGLLVSALLRDSLGGQVVVTCAGLVLGVSLGVFFYRRNVVEPRLVITQVIQKGEAMQSLSGEDLSCFEAGTSGCEGCIGKNAGN